MSLKTDAWRDALEAIQTLLRDLPERERDEALEWIRDVSDAALAGDVIKTRVLVTNAERWKRAVDIPFGRPTDTPPSAA